MTFLPSSENARLEIDFINFKTEANYDKIFVYDGTSLNAPLIGSYSGNHGPGTVTATNPEGALTFRFISDGLQDGTGWTAQISCIPGLGINENTLQNVSVYPNPAKGNFTKQHGKRYKTHPKNTF